MFLSWEDGPPLYTDTPCLESVWSGVRVERSSCLPLLTRPPLNLVLLHLHFLLCLPLGRVDVSCVSHLCLLHLLSVFPIIILTPHVMSPELIEQQGIGFNICFPYGLGKVKVLSSFKVLNSSVNNDKCSWECGYWLLQWEWSHQMPWFKVELGVATALSEKREGIPLGIQKKIPGLGMWRDS